MPAVRVQQVVDDPTPPQCVTIRDIRTRTRTAMLRIRRSIQPQEMVDLMGAMRSYQLNASAVAATKQMIEQSMSLLK